uniref:Enoyl-CoA hydratase/isomerase family protein n=1 Tax=Gongylonema pulchrum TaxID=637853 RepID=A0A183EZF4_9BILA
LRSHKRILQTLIKLAAGKTDALIQALIIVGGERSICGGLAARRNIEMIAAAEFQNLVQHKLFGYIPPIVFGNIIARYQQHQTKIL